jgi:formamidopyrimidine-DNA glycosylase
MPELPEVETLCRQLRQVVSASKISEIQVLDHKIGEVGGLAGREILAVNRQGKMLELEVTGNLVIVFHFRMTGRLLWHIGDELFSHVRSVISLSEGRILLIDPRRFATVSVHNKERNPSFLGIDPFDDFNPLYFWEFSQRSRFPIKAFLMDQRRIAGIGNIYACEILHQAHINPWRRACDLSLAEWETIADVTIAILSKAVVYHGTTISDWRDLFNRKGMYQNHLAVYARKGERCRECGGEIQRRKLNGRGTYFCPACQN